MPDSGQQAQPTPRSRAVSDEVITQARGRLSDRGIDPHQIIGQGDFGEISVAGFYVMLGMVAATEKAGQNPTFAMARLALHAGLPSEVADTLFLAYNQQSAEEAGHGDKVFGNAYYSMGGFAPSADQSAVGSTNGSDFLLPGDDKKENKKRLGTIAGVLGGIETVALNRVFPLIVSLCEGWDHPVARDLHMQIRDNVRPEESRHVLNWRYVFHHMIAPKGEHVINLFFDATNNGRRVVAGTDIDRETFARMLGSTAPTPRQLLGKDRAI